MKVLYLVGMGRSGSTLLDILLDAHSRIRSLGGVQRLVHYASKQPCPCGAPSFQECPFWVKVDQEVRQRIGRSLTTVQVNSRNKQVFREHNHAVFESASAVADAEFVTDNSKSGHRLKRLMAHTGMEVIPIHVLRDPRGRAQSVRKRKNRSYMPALSYSYRALRLFTLLYGKSHIVVDYDRLAKDPQGEVAKLMRRLGLEHEPQQMSWAEHSHHNIGAADVLQKTEGSTIRPDDAWKERLSEHEKKIVSAIASPGLLANRIKERRWGLENGPDQEKTDNKAS